MRWLRLLRAFRSRLLARGTSGSSLTGPDGNADDATVVVPASQAVTVAAECPPWDRSPQARARKPLPWPARDVSRSLRPPGTGEVAAQFPASPAADGPDADDVTAVVSHPAGDDARDDPDVTVVWPRGDGTRRHDA